MSFKKYFCTAVITLFTATAFAQDKNYDISTAVGFDAAGINKVLCMKNGYTLLFHLELGKPLTVQVFDTAHKRVANAQPDTRLLNTNMLRLLIFKGLYDIGGEAVLFIEQPNSGRHSLLRMRINAANGRLIEEETIGKARSIAKPMKFFVMKEKKNDNYAVLFSEDVSQFKTADLRVAYYNRRHERYKEVPLIFDRHKYDYLDVTEAEALPDGICIGLTLSTLLLNGTGTMLEKASVYDHHLGLFFIPKDSLRPVSKFIDVTADIFPYYANAACNPFAGTINFLLLSYREIVYQYGIEMRPLALMGNIFFKLDEDNMALNYTALNNKLANNELKEQTDTSHSYKGLPLKLITNANGLSTMVSEAYTRYLNVETKARPDLYESFFGDICITRFDDNGREIWGTILPKSQYFKSYRHFYSAYELSKKWQHQELMNDLPAAVYDRQFVSCNTYAAGSNVYVVFNDYSKNLNNSNGQPGDTVFTFDHTNTCYYKLDQNNEVTKHYMFGEPLNKEYKCSFIEGADYDEQRSTYAALIQYKRGAYVSLRMAWRRLD